MLGITIKDNNIVKKCGVGYWTCRLLLSQRKFEPIQNQICITIVIGIRDAVPT